jgi:hypothetical protein
MYAFNTNASLRLVSDLESEAFFMGAAIVGRGSKGLPRPTDVPPLLEL